MKYQLYTNASKNNRWLLVVISKWFVWKYIDFYDPSWMLQLSKFVWTLRSSVWVVFNHNLLIDATDSSKMSSDQKRLFFDVRLYPLSFFANTNFKGNFRNFITRPLAANRTRETLVNFVQQVFVPNLSILNYKMKIRDFT